MGTKVGLAVLFLTGALWAQSNSLMGIWKLNSAQSTFDPGPPPKSVTVKYEPHGKDGVRITVDTIDARGILTHAVYTAKYDGKDNAVKGDSSRDTVALKRIDPYTMEVTNKERGKVTTINTIIVSKDGRTRTDTIRGTNSQGQRVNNVAVFEKQQGFSVKN
ncbi:MAG TPA: hypothetical protein VNE63_17750 [Candidatus Acidoferrales bacterium]|nr:hypothetical protein [Candidatus Acidoferrales bacterium]